MGTRSKDKIKAMIEKDILNIYNHYMNVKQTLNDNLVDTLEYMHALITQIPQSASGPLITKTPKAIRKRTVQRIETIPEDDVINIDNTLPDPVVVSIKQEQKEIETSNVEETGRSKRQASKVAETNIRKMQSLKLLTKLRRPSDFDESARRYSKKKNDSRLKRKKSARSSSDEDSTYVQPKHSKKDENHTVENGMRKTNEIRSEEQPPVLESIIQEDKNNATMTLRRSSRKRSSLQDTNLINKKPDNMDDTLVAPKEVDMQEISLYEDAIGKPMPIMNSTMNLTSAMNDHKVMNATVVLEPLSAIKLNETVTILKNANNINEKDNPPKAIQSKTEFKLSDPKVLQDRMKQLKEAIANKELDDLLTDDETSPETKSKRNTKKQENRKRPQRLTWSMTSSEDEILCSPVKPALKQMKKAMQDKNTYKSNALFSPYAKESVKKRVEAFEQAGMSSPKSVEIDAPTRVTRTKTRALAAAQAEDADGKAADKVVAHKLARKSLAKAKKISLAKQAKDTDEYKENRVQSIQKVSKLIPPDKLNLKQQKTTPMGKSKIQLPMSVSRIPQTPSNSQINGTYAKTLSATRGNIVTSVDSFLPVTKSVNKPSSVDKLEEKKRKLNEEDARKKREDALRLLTEEKRRKRQEKELKNKLAREAKEKENLEKRQKAEKEREEKARLAQQMQEKHREEMERKRIAQVQRAQEKEERKKQEEQLRMQRVQDQEEAERLLAAQRRREQEAEKRKEMELRAQQQAATESLKSKNQLLAAQSKYANKHHGPTSYVLDSEPDDDDSDDESRPKHTIPYWADSQIRKDQLLMQQYIPERAVFKFFDTRKCTPDLTELFQGIDRSRLKRTSSAIWKSPPRYSMMNTTQYNV